MLFSLTSTSSSVLVHATAGEPRMVLEAAPVRAGKATAADAVWRRLMSVWARLVAWKMRRATRIILGSLDDRILNDIGLKRSEIDRVLFDLERRTLTWL